MAIQKIEESVTLSEADIDPDLFNDYDAEFHIISGRESNTDDNVIDTTPNPTVRIYQQNNHYSVIIFIPYTDDIILGWVQEEPSDEEFLRGVISSIDDGYNGIENVTDFKSDDPQIRKDVEKSFSEILKYMI